MEERLILCIETSTQACSVALAKNGKTWILREVEGLNLHATQLTLLIEACMQDAQLPLSALDAIAVCAGPGSYTGLRIGSSTAKGLAMSLQKPLLVVSTLEAMAWEARTLFGRPDDIFVGLIDARRMDAYALSIDYNGQQLQAAHFTTLQAQQWQTLGTGRVVLAGDATEKYPEATDENVLKTTIKASAAYLCPLADQAFQSSDFTDYIHFEPLYIKKPHITTSKKKYF